MPRQSYEAHRAAKLGVGTRRPSVVESETDAESLTSYTTFQSHNSSSSYAHHPRHLDLSTSISPPPRLASFTSHTQLPHAHLRPGVPYRTSSTPDSRARRSSSQTGSRGSPGSPLRPDDPGGLRQRTMSSSSSQFQAFAPGPIGNTSALGLTVPLAEHGRRSSATSVEREQWEQRRKRREERRAERAERSTLKGEGYDSPLRRFIRGLSVRERSAWGLPIGLAAVGAVKVAVAMSLRRTDGCERTTVDVLGKLALEAVFWWSAVIAWNISEGRRTGRSWRTQLTGILTVLSHPALILLEATSARSLSIPLGLAFWAIIFLSKGWDVFAMIPLGAAAAFGGARWWWVIPASGTYVLGNGIIKGGKNGVRHALGSGIAFAVACLVGSSPAPSAWTVPKSAASVWRHIASPSSAVYAGQLAITGLNVCWLESNRSSHVVDGQKYTAFGLLSLAASLSILLFASMSLRGHQASTTPSPTFRLLLPALLASIAGLYLFTPAREPTDMLPLFLPFLAMLSLRGGQDGLGETEAWESGVSFTCLSCAKLMADLERGAAQLALTLMILWILTIGLRVFKTGWIQRVYLIAFPLMILCELLPLFAETACHIYGPSPRVSRIKAWSSVATEITWLGTVGVVWVWAVRKLLENSWGIAGLGAGGGRKKTG